MFFFLCVSLCACLSVPMEFIVCQFLYCISLHTHTKTHTCADGGPLSHVKGPGIPVVILSRKERDAMRGTQSERCEGREVREGLCFCLTPALRRSTRHTRMLDRTHMHGNTRSRNHIVSRKKLDKHVHMHAHLHG